MPSGLKRFQQAEALHFITFRCFHRLRVLEAPEARERFEIVLKQTRARHQARVYADVLMPDHVHLLVNEPPRIVLAQFLKAVKQITSRQLRGSRKKFWQERYYDREGPLRGDPLYSSHSRCPRRTTFVRWGKSRWRAVWSGSPKTGSLTA